MRLTCLRNVLKFGAIWFINDKFVGTKLRWVILRPNFRSPLAPKLLVGHKKSRWAQNGTDMLYPHAKFGDLPPHGGEIITQVSNFAVCRPCGVTLFTD